MEMNFTLLGFVLGILLLIALVVSFVESAKNTNQGFIDKLLELIPGMNKDTAELPSDFDEERIYEGTLIKIDQIPTETESGLMMIKKQQPEKGWNLEYDEEEYYALYSTRQIDRADLPDQWVILSEKSLNTILSSEMLHGIVQVNGKRLVHTPSQHKGYWFEDKNEDYTYDQGEAFEDKNNDYCWNEGEPLTDNDADEEYDGEALCLDEVRNIILADLVEKST